VETQQVFSTVGSWAPFTRRVVGYEAPGIKAPPSFDGHGLAVERLLPDKTCELVKADQFGVSKLSQNGLQMEALNAKRAA